VITATRQLTRTIGKTRFDREVAAKRGLLAPGDPSMGDRDPAGKRRGRGAAAQRVAPRRLAVTVTGA